MPRHRPADQRVPISVLASVDPVLRDSAVLGLVVDSPGTVALRHDILAEEGLIRRVVVDASGVVEQVLVPLEHACLSCAVREDALPTLAALTEDGRWSDVIMALPVSAESLPVTRALTAETRRGGLLDGARIATAATVADVETFEHDLLAADLLAERGIALTPDDERSVGEALAAQVEHADLVVAAGEAVAAPTGSGLVDRLRAEDSARVEGLHGVTAADLAAGRHDPVRGERRSNPLGARRATGDAHATGDRSWTLELRSDRPFHPERLLDRIEDLGTGRLRSRGVFHVVDRPLSACLWDGAGGQLFLGDLGTWDEAAASAEPHTRIVVVGSADDDASTEQDVRHDLVDAFHDALVRPDEIADGGLSWLGRQDVLSPWLGSRS
ncbi:GTP-binding protein [Myceligenerans salitolerans]|uniref:GTP-binding protein n=1 Tax=Myceligenerans salitolerans TaxID=1230528 RepID=A0ABS3I522_9MICO|nr:GTP-binding protein [Myceligenerans salitolerans]MBO0608096.1 GTP-binding protein [Myceligenerans salitolerans]